MKRRHHALVKQLAFPVLYIMWTLLLVLWVIWLAHSH